jgi:hypothetical protein
MPHRVERPTVYDRCARMRLMRAPARAGADAGNREAPCPGIKILYKNCTRGIDIPCVLYIIASIGFRRVYNFVMQSSLSSVLPPEEKLSSPAAAGDTPFYSRASVQFLPRRLVGSTGR